MKAGWLVLAPVVLVTACAQHSRGYDDAFAECQAEATKQMEVAQPQPDQRSEWQENYISGCMAKKGFTSKSMM
jgi:apolipoprotein N-acyltransferase